MDKTCFDRLLQQLLPEMDNHDARKALVTSALYGSPLLELIQWEGSARAFTVRLIQQLHEYGELAPGKPALIALLEENKKQVGEDRQRYLDELIVVLKASPDVPEIALPTEKIEGELSVFISYARPNQAIAEQVESYLKGAGVRVFRDTSDIGAGADWDTTIEQALQECQRMVLLLSAASMPFRREVHREWFYFDQKRKPLYPLYIQECELHSRMYAYNYIDVRGDLQAGLERLLNELRRDFDLPSVSTGADKVGVFTNVVVEPRTLPEALQALLDAVRDPEGGVVLSTEQAEAIRNHKPEDLTEYRLGRIAEWSLPQYQLDDRFVNLTLLLDKGEHEAQRWQNAEHLRFNDLREVLTEVPDPVLVLLGAPGSGKSTLLRRLQLDHSMDRLRDDSEQISFFIQLNAYRADTDGKLPLPLAWLAERWTTHYPALEPLPEALKAGQVLLLLDALNEMPHKDDTEYRERIGFWRSFAQDAAQMGNRVLFSCRSLDYSASLSSPDLRVPQIEVQPMSADQVHKFIGVYLPAHQDMVWRELKDSPQFDLFKTPYFLSLLCQQVTVTRSVPRGRASLFTGFVRQALDREINTFLFQPDSLLNHQDHQKLALRGWRSPFDLPERGLLIPRLSQLAFRMQQDSISTESKQVRIDHDDACTLINHDRSEDILKAGIALNVLDEDITRYEITFFHQLLQEFFAARTLAQTPDPTLVHVEWQIYQVSPTLDETLATLADGDPLPPLPQTGWEETTLTAAPMANDPNTFIRNLIPHNLPLAARCAASPEVKIDPALKREIQQALIARSQDYTNADLRARIAAGLVLGELGDPRFERKQGPHGDYLLPPMVNIRAGTYLIGDNDSQYDAEKPAHTVELDAFQIGMFPVTNSEYVFFIGAGGYEDEQWWETDESIAWLRGEGSTEGQKASWRNTRHQLSQIMGTQLRGMTNLTTEQKDLLIDMQSWSDDFFESWLKETFPSGKIYRQSEFWNDSRFNNPNQPIVGVTWFEACAYCKWLSAQAGQIYTLPSEVQFEAAARGIDGRVFTYGSVFDSIRSNTFESHIRRTTPVGIFDNATSEVVFDMSGNTYTWTTTIYDQDKFPYPYRANDGREDMNNIDVRRVLRGGSWINSRDYARAIFRNRDLPFYRYEDFGFRLCRPLRAEM